jgi:hypothetical protein
MSASVVASVVGIAAGAKSLGLFGGGGGSSSNGSSGGANGSYDPYGQFRQGDAQQLHDLRSNPSSVLGDAGYQQQLKQGMDTTTRGMARAGMRQSGNEQIELNSVGQNTFGSYYNTKLANLMQTSGAAQNPASAGLAQAQANKLQNGVNQSNLGMMASSAGGLYNAYQNWTGGGSGGNSNNSNYFGGSGGGWSAQADTGAAASTASDFYGSTYDAGAGWSS